MEKRLYAEFVSLTDGEYMYLTEKKYGGQELKQRIANLDRSKREDPKKTRDQI
ncbi:hypothetical protein GCM10020331_059480 [Ectobacillus funiculus]